jgi:uncharacterized membrane protein
MTQLASRFHLDSERLHGAFGADSFGRKAEAFARWFGTPTFLVAQTAVVTVWILLNVVMAALRWDIYPFILLNLAFSLQGAYAAPLILLAQARQADRDKALSEADIAHREALAHAAVQRQDIALEQTARLEELLAANTALTEEVRKLTREIHERIVPAEGDLNGQPAHR